MTDYTELKRLAEGAVEAGDHWGRRDSFERQLAKLDTPETVLALIAENERLTGCIVQRRAQAEQYDQALIKMAAERDRLKAENDQLFGETERLKAEVARSTEREILQMAEIEVLRNAFRPLLAHWDDLKAGESLNVDAARAAMGKGEQS